MAWCRIQLTEDERRVVNEERTSHPNLLVRNKMLTIWLLHCGVTRQKAADIVGVSRATVRRPTWTRTAKADWTGCGIRVSKRPSASWLPSVHSPVRRSKSTCVYDCRGVRPNREADGIRRSPTQYANSSNAWD